MTEIIIYAIIAGIGICIPITILGNFVSWKKISYIGDSVAHSSILGVAVSLILPGNSMLWIILVCLCGSYIMVWTNKKYKISHDSLLIFNTQVSLSFAIVLISMFSQRNLNLNNYFFGNILSINFQDIITIYIIGIISLFIIFINWSKFLLITINEDIAEAEGLNTFKYNLIFISLISSVVACSIKFAGFLLIPSLLIIPNMIVNKFTKNPLSTILISCLISIISVVLGVLTSMYIDISTSPLISVILITVLLVSLLINKREA